MFEPSPDLKPAEQRLLREILARTLALEKAKRPTAPDFRGQEDFDEQKANGVRYRPTEWFTSEGEGMPEADRVAYLRATHKLIRAGHLIGVRSDGGKLQFVSLTDAGRAKALASSRAQTGQEYAERRKEEAEKIRARSKTSGAKGRDIGTIPPIVKAGPEGGKR